MILSERQEQEFLKFIKKSDFTNHTFTFGPYDRDRCRYLYSVLLDIGAGYHAAHAGDRVCFSCDSTEIEPKRNGKFSCKLCKNEQDIQANSKGRYLVYVTHRQADKVLKFVSSLTNQTFEEITDGNYVAPPTEKDPWLVAFSERWESKPVKEKKKKGRPKKQKEDQFNEVKVSFKGMVDK